MVDKKQLKPEMVKDIVGSKKLESKDALFIRLATQRVDKVLNSLRILGNCSNKSIYAYTEVQILKIAETLNEAIVKTMSKFQNTKKEREAFKF